jgi:hypothetical protein
MIVAGHLTIWKSPIRADRNNAFGEPTGKSTLSPRAAVVLGSIGHALFGARYGREMPSIAPRSLHNRCINRCYPIDF